VQAQRELTHPYTFQHHQFLGSMEALNHQLFKKKKKIRKCKKLKITIKLNLAQNVIDILFGILSL